MNRDYIYYSYTKTLCSVCQRPIDGKIVYNDKGVFIVKTCSDHGQFSTTFLFGGCTGLF
ncbi:MAG: hypothetical protein Q8935_18155 [Bacillota bacterium]|nr:hypothetical protein [Bacillota bacterium]